MSSQERNSDHAYNWVGGSGHGRKLVRMGECECTNMPEKEQARELGGMSEGVEWR